MQLLDKKKVQAQKSAEKKLEIDEGVKIARRIDVLRETYAKEEKNLREFRDKSLETVRAEILEQTTQRDSLTLQCESLREERARLQEPLDKEWAKLREREATLKETSEQVEQRIDQFTEQIKALDTRSHELELEEERVKDIKEQANLNHDESVRLKVQASHILSGAEETERQTLARLEEKRQELLSREALVASREREIEIKDALLKKKEKELTDFERMVNDKYATLIRNQARLKAKKK